MSAIHSDRAVSISLAWLVCCLLSACGAPAVPPPQHALRVGYLNSSDANAYFVMVEQGFADKNGLRIEETAFQSGGPVLDELAGGSIDVGMDVGTVPLLLRAERGQIPNDFVPIAIGAVTDPEHRYSAVVVNPAIQSWQDLAGKSIGVNSVTSITGAAIRIRLQQEDVTNVNLIEMSFSNMGLALAGGNVAAAVMVEPYISQSIARGDGKVLDWVVGGPPFERMPMTMVVVRGDLYRNQPETVKALLRAHLQAARWIEQNPAPSRSTLTKRLALSEEIGQKMALPLFPTGARVDPQQIEAIQQSLLGVGILKAAFPVNRLMDETLLAEVLGEKWWVEANGP